MYRLPTRVRIAIALIDCVALRPSETPITQTSVTAFNADLAIGFAFTSSLADKILPDIVIFAATGREYLS